MTAYKKGSIVLVNFNPQKRSQEVGKTRPAIILSDSELNAILDLITVIPLTTNLIDDAEPLRVRIPPRQNLKEPSDAMIEQIRSVAKSRIGESIGELGDEELAKIEVGVKAMLGFS